MSTLFLSYRRADSPGTVGRLREHLTPRLRRWKLFYDHNSMGLGEDFPDRLRQEVISARVVLAIIGPRWLESLRQRAGTLDHVREEIRLALQAGNVVIPVLVENAALPEEADLADFPELSPLRRLHGRAVRPDPDFDTDLERLAAYLDEIGPGVGVGTILAKKYSLVREIGQGGMGIVYEAEQLQPRRRVAVKMILEGMDTKEVLARFDGEKEALARLSHPNIARVIDAGAAPTGRPFFVMEFVRGGAITEFCDRKHLSLADRLDLFLDVCAGIQHAHRKGIVHRDLKPSNILVQEVDGRPIPKVIDFGVAKATTGRLTDKTLVSEVGRLIGSLLYASPEQVAGQAETDTLADVYSLGAVLHELLVGEPPYTEADLRAEGEQEMRRRIMAGEHQRPSARLAAAKGASRPWAQQGTLAGLQRALRRDLDWILLRALEPDPTRRYQGVSHLAADVRNYLDNQPIAAGPTSRLYAFAKFLKRNRLMATAVSAVLVTAVVGFGVATGFAMEARDFAERIVAPASVVRADLAIERAAELLPAWPSRRPALDGWLANARELVGRVSDFEGRAAAVAPGAVGGARASELEFEAQREQRETLGRLLPRLRDLQALIPEMERARLWSSTIGEASQQRRDARLTWDYVRKTLASADGAIVSADYRGKAIELLDENVVGLVPLGINPRSKLWEFYDLASAFDGSDALADLSVPAYRDAAGRIDVRSDTGIVFVLLPGGRFTMGAQAEDANAPNYDLQAHPNEWPPHEVALDAFLIARHELTRGQWRRLTSAWGTRKPASEEIGQAEKDRMPETQMSWTEAAEHLRRHGMVLPTEAQWEYACRGGKSWPWSSGADHSNLSRFANVAGSREKAGLGHVGLLWPNEFGLHDVHGNAMEWCRDWYVEEYSRVSASAGDGLRVFTPSQATAERRVVRGGNYFAEAEHARSSRRIDNVGPGQRERGLGLRPARSLRP